jgi:sec-independent protein translocase protein TatC
MTALADDLIESPPDSGGLMAMVPHLRELRRRALISASAILLSSIVAFAFHAAMLHALTGPYCGLPTSYRLLQGRCTLIVTGVLDAFRVTLKLSLYAGVVLSSPVWLYQVWRFITPALHRNERRYATFFVVSSLSLFALGGTFAWLTLTRGLEFLLGFATGSVAPLLSFDSYLSFVTALVLVFGASFEFPLLVIMLNVTGVLSAARLKRCSRAIIFGIGVFAAGATPSQDPFTMLALVVPLCLLYVLALSFAIVHDRRAQTRARTALALDLSDDELSSLEELSSPDDRPGRRQR